MTAVDSSTVRRPWDLIFDADDTLWACSVYYRQADHNCLAIIQDALGVPLDLQASIVRARLVQRASLRRWGYYLDIYEDAWVETYYQIAHRFGRAISQKVAADVHVAARSVKTAPYSVFDDVVPTLTELRRNGHRLHVLSLGDETIQMAKIDRNRMTGLFDSTHIIQRSKGLKMRLIAMNGRRTMMIGDSLHSDITPAVKLGLEAAWIHNTEIWGQTHNPLDMSRVHVIHHVRELPAIIVNLSD